jgi:riboflavin synthase alpha subunit
MSNMRIAPGKVVDGRVELDAELPEGACVTVLALEGDETFEADPHTETMLLDAIAQCQRGQTTPLKDVLDEMRSRE